MYAGRHENKAVHHQPLWSYWLEEDQPGHIVQVDPLLLHDGGVNSLVQVSASRLPGLVPK